MATRTSEEYEAEIAALKAQVAQYKTRTAMTMFGRVTAAPRQGTMTIAGLEEMILQVSGDDTVGYANNPMMRLLGMPDRKAVLGTPLSHWDRGPMEENTFAALVQMARGAQEPQAVERPCPEVPADRLPSSDLPAAAGDRVLRFTATPHKGSVQIIVQDVTRTRWLETTFARYVSPKVIEKLQQIPATEMLAMERRDLTILFADMRGFTRLCQEAAPAQVQDTVNSFLANMVACIESVDGTVQGFVGDQVMAMFGAPLPQEDHALRALICAVAMQRVHAQWTSDRLARGLPAPPVGVGLATGSVVVGNIGTQSRMDYTAQGHGVNLAARLCAAAEGGEILTVPETHAAAGKSIKTYDGDVPVPHFAFASKGKLAFKNVANPVDVLSVKVKG